MTKARRAMQEDLKLVDLVMELTDARAPLAGRNPDIDKLAAGKARMIFLNKADLADDQATLAWMDYFRKKGIKHQFVLMQEKQISKKLSLMV